MTSGVEMDKRHVFGEPKWVMTFGQQFRFETMSILGKVLEPLRPKSTKNQKYLHVGCGDIFLKGFLNVDFYSPKLVVKRVLRIAPRDVKFRGHDFRRQLPFRDSSFLGAFSEHTLEHLDPWHAQRLLREIRRVLKAGSKLRIVVPNLDSYLQFCSGEEPDKAFSKFEGRAEAIWCLTQNWGHQSVWNFDNLEKALKNAGFKSVERVSFGFGRDSNLINDLPRRKWESLYVEAEV